ncbi:hypothetical protein C1645_877337 [Glomus cerebriforme]|uniref:Uncharacterized protein n=1 Tax=Glomus cerebriforme TaxID=658196 RepID=A0A397SQV7_9GLOM|nr:hypothetical protein C1645_877337 [Glomus cerebriforme]
MTEMSSLQRPQIKTTSISFSISSKNILPETSINQQILQSPLTYNFKDDNISSPTNKKQKSNTLSSIFSFSRSNSHYRSETYQENYEFNKGCFGFLNTLGSKIKYKVNYALKRIKIKCRSRKDKDEWKSRAKTL